MNYHVYKSSCKKASRVLMQSKWEDESSVFVDVADDSDWKLGFGTLFKLFVRSPRGSRMIFHAQSSLPYLMFSLFFQLMLAARKIKLIYDMHDLHERPCKSQNNLAYFRSIIRYVIFYILEFIVCRVSTVRVMTVSSGLAKIAAQRYRFKDVTVIRNISVAGCLISDVPVALARDKLVYFGIFEHISADFLEVLSKFGFEIDIYGRGDESTIRNLVRIPRVEFKGQYSATDMSFLRNYSACILFNDSDILNNKIALPNKIYQSLYSGLPVIVSKNFELIPLEFPDFPDFIYVLNFLSEKSFSDLRFWLDWRGRIANYSVRINELRGVIDRKILNDKFVYLSL